LLRHHPAIVAWGCHDARPAGAEALDTLLARAALREDGSRFVYLGDDTLGMPRVGAPALPSLDTLVETFDMTVTPFSEAFDQIAPEHRKALTDGLAEWGLKPEDSELFLQTGVNKFNAEQSLVFWYYGPQEWRILNVRHGEPIGEVFWNRDNLRVRMSMKDTHYLRPGQPGPVPQVRAEIHTRDESLEPFTEEQIARQMLHPAEADEYLRYIEEVHGLMPDDVVPTVAQLDWPRYTDENGVTRFMQPVEHRAYLDSPELWTHFATVEHVHPLSPNGVAVAVRKKRGNREGAGTGELVDRRSLPQHRQGPRRGAHRGAEQWRRTLEPLALLASHACARRR